MNNKGNSQQVTVNLDDLRTVLRAVDYVGNSSLRGPVDRMGDACAVVAMQKVLDAETLS